ncbi:hypothetical protein LBMAG53_07580 [Planctomycetota bacterium]|nr:hypothetical protein LBMAG53_07580 [Planctomycetota bacterium]
MTRVLTLLLLLWSVLVAAEVGGSATPASSPSATAAKASEPAAASSATAGLPSKAGIRAAYLKIEDTIDDMQVRYVERTLKAAKEQGVQVIVTHIVSDGGYLHSAQEIVNKFLDLPKDGPRLVAFIDRKAWSAAAMIAYSNHEVHLTNSGLIGDIGVIFIKDDEIKYAPEKIETAVRTMLRSIAQNRGWNEAKLVKMTARNQELYRFSMPTEGNKPAHYEWVIQDDLATFLAQHPDLDPNAKLIVKNGEKDRLMSYTAREAVEEGMATGTVASLDDLYAKLGVTKESLVDLSRNTNESVAWYLSGWAPLLASLTILFIILELKSGTGLFIILAACTGAAFLFCQFYLDMANAFDVVLMLIGLALVIVDLFVLPTGGLLAACGAAVGLVGLTLSFMPNATQFSFAAPEWGKLLVTALGRSLLSVAVVAFGAVVLISAAPRLGLFRRIAVQAEIGGTSDSPSIGSSLVGRTATCRTALHPGGFVVLGGGDRAGEELSASAEHGEHLPAGAQVEIVSTSLGEVIVRLKTA